ncbi:hypothetical protein ACYULU_03125 [Breznakiellaceae bacterium SP9]
MLEDTIAVTIRSNEHTIKCIPLLCKFTGMPIGEIKSLIEQNKPVVVFYHTRPDTDLSSLQQLLLALVGQGAVLEIVENLVTGKLTSSAVVDLTFIDNLVQTYEEISRENEMSSD